MGNEVLLKMIFEDYQILFLALTEYRAHLIKLGMERNAEQVSDIINDLNSQKNFLNYEDE